MSKLYRVMGCKHSQEVTYYHWDADHKYPRRELLQDTMRVFEAEFESMDEASLWLITYHPDLYMGHSVVALDDSGDFSVHCVPDYYYSEMNTLDDDKIIYEEMNRLICRVHFKNTPAIPHVYEGNINNFNPDDHYDEDLDLNLGESDLDLDLDDDLFYEDLDYIDKYDEYYAMWYDHKYNRVSRNLKSYKGR